MGFFKTLHNIIQGKPLFETDEQQKIGKPQQIGQVQPVNTGQKTIPVAQIERTECHNNGDHMNVRCEIRNDSNQVIELDKIRILGTVREIDTHLRPGEARELVVYSGKRPNNRNYSTAELNYKDMLGDYFQAKCAVEFRQEQDNTYSIYRIKLAGPIKDIQ